MEIFWSSDGSLDQVRDVMKVLVLKGVLFWVSVQKIYHSNHILCHFLSFDLKFTEFAAFKTAAPRKMPHTFVTILVSSKFT